MENIDFPFADLIGLKIEHMHDGKSRCNIDIERKHMSTQKAVHGAVAYALADTGMGTALYSLLEEGLYCATNEIKIS